MLKIVRDPPDKVREFLAQILPADVQYAQVSPSNVLAYDVIGWAREEDDVVPVHVPTQLPEGAICRFDVYPINDGEQFVVHYFCGAPRASARF